MIVCRSRARCSDIVASLNELEVVVNRFDTLLAQSNNLDLIFSILQYAKLLFAVEKIKDFSGIDFKVACTQKQILVGPGTGLFQQCKDILCRQGVDAFRRVLCFAMKIAAHSVCLATAGLSIGKTSGHATIENGLDQWPSSEMIDHLIVGGLVERIIKAKALILQILG